jgi:hypothetical protein
VPVKQERVPVELGRVVVEMPVRVAAAAQRGEDYAAVGRRLGIREVTVRWWASKIRCRATQRGEAKTARALAPSFVEVQVAAVRLAPGFEAALHSGREVRVPNGFDANELSRLIVVLEQPYWIDRNARIE